MNRREALKSITLASGLVISSTTIVALMQLCREPQNAPWHPLFFTRDEAIIIDEIADFIIPSGTIFGALNVGVPKVIDLLIADMFDVRDGQKFRQGMQTFANHFKDRQKITFIQADAKERQSFIRQLYDLPKEEEKAVFDLLAQGMNHSLDLCEKYYLYNFLVTLRNFTIITYLTSEKVGKEVLSYDPIPGRYDGCVPLAEVGNVWSITYDNL